VCCIAAPFDPVAVLQNLRKGNPTTTNCPPNRAPATPVFALCCRPEHVDPIAVLQDLREGTDHTIINDYFDTIEQLVTLVLEGQGQRAKDEGLCDAVLHLQEVGGSLASRQRHLLAVLWLQDRCYMHCTASR
jgi:hypothetical protein